MDAVNDLMLMDLAAEAGSNVDAYFGRDGYLGDQSGFEARPEQQALAREVFACMAKADALRGERCALLPVQGETGIGKTLASLVPMLDRVARLKNAGNHVRCGYATYTTQLRRQVAHKDLPVAIRAVAAKTGVTLSFAEYWGSAQYLSPTEVQSARNDIEQAFAKTVDARGHSQMQAQLDRLKSLQRELSGQFAHGALIVEIKAALKIPEHEPLVPGFPDSRFSCHWREAKTLSAYCDMRERVKTADILLVSHAAALVNAHRWFSMLDPSNAQQEENDDDGENEDGHIRYMVFDEAHRLPDAARNLTDRFIPLRRIVQVLESAHHADLGQVRDKDLLQTARHLCDGLRAEGEEGIVEHTVLPLFETVPSGNGTVLQVLRRSGLPDLYDAMKMATNGLVTKRLKSQEQKTALNDLRDLVEEMSDYMDRFNKADKNPYQIVAGLSWSPVLRNPSLRMASLSPGRMVARYWRHYPGKKKPEEAKGSQLWGAVILSATLPDLPSIGIFNAKEEAKETQAWMKSPFLMIEDTRFPPVFEPEHFGEMDFVLSAGAPETMRNKKDHDVDDDDDGQTRYVNPEWETAHLFPMISALLHAAGQDGVLILTPAFPDVEAIGNFLTKTWTQLGSRLILQSSEKNLSMCAHQFRIHPGSILVSAGGWEGLDLPGQIRHLMITRLPRPPIDEMHEKILMEKYSREKTMGILHARNLFMARAKLRQGIGRGIRQSQDRVTVWLADGRFGLPKRITDMADRRVTANADTAHKMALDAIPKRFRMALLMARVFQADYGVFMPDKTEKRHDRDIDAGESLSDFFE